MDGEERCRRRQAGRSTGRMELSTTWKRATPYSSETVIFIQPELLWKSETADPCVTSLFSMRRSRRLYGGCSETSRERWEARQAVVVRTRACRIVNLCCDHKAIATGRLTYRLADYSFAFALIVNVRGVNEVHPDLNGMSDNPQGFRFARSRAKVHGSETKSRNTHAGAAKRSILYQLPFYYFRLRMFSSMNFHVGM